MSRPRPLSPARKPKKLWHGRCPVTNKRCYDQSLDVLLDNMHNPRTIRAYRCEFDECRKWHATSKPLRNQEAA